MKKQFLFLMLLTLFSTISYSQTWSRNGLNSGSGGNNTIGTSDNFPIEVYTNFIQRLKLNEDITYSVNGFNAQRNGYMFLGHSQTYSSGVSAYSLLHLNGPNGTFVQAEGYRPWMQTGMTLTDNNDVSCMNSPPSSPANLPPLFEKREGVAEHCEAGGELKQNSLPQLLKTL